MTAIAEAIGWKFNHQPGMRTKNGVIVEFPGGIPTQADQDLWTTEYEASDDFKGKNVRNDVEYPSEEDIHEALLGPGVGALNSLKAHVRTLETKHGL